MDHLRSLLIAAVVSGLVACGSSQTSRPAEARAAERRSADTPSNTQAPGSWVLDEDGDGLGCTARLPDGSVLLVGGGPPQRYLADGTFERVETPGLGRVRYGCALVPIGEARWALLGGEEETAADVVLEGAALRPTTLARPAGCSALGRTTATTVAEGALVASDCGVHLLTASLEWSRVADNRDGGSVAALGGGRTLLLGHRSVGSAALYEAGELQPLPDLPQARPYVVTATLSSGDVLVAGGESQATAVFDQQTLRWREGADTQRLIDGELVALPGANTAMLLGTHRDRTWAELWDGRRWRLDARAPRSIGAFATPTGAVSVGPLTARYDASPDEWMIRARLGETTVPLADGVVTYWSGGELAWVVPEQAGRLLPRPDGTCDRLLPREPAAWGCADESAGAWWQLEGERWRSTRVPWGDTETNWLRADHGLSWTREGELVRFPYGAEGEVVAQRRGEQVGRPAVVGDRWFLNSAEGAFVFDDAAGALAAIPAPWPDEPAAGVWFVPAGDQLFALASFERRATALYEPAASGPGTWRELPDPPTPFPLNAELVAVGSAWGVLVHSIGEPMRPAWWHDGAWRTTCESSPMQPAHLATPYRNGWLIQEGRGPARWLERSDFCEP